MADITVQLLIRLTAIWQHLAVKVVFLKDLTDEQIRMMIMMMMIMNVIVIDYSTQNLPDASAVTLCEFHSSLPNTADSVDYKLKDLINSFP